MPEVKDILKRVKKLEIKTNRLVDGLIAGNYHSVFRGRGMEFSEVREYVPGDDVRAIDWNVTARFDSPFVKEFIEERDLNVYIVFDASASNEFGCEKSKKETAFEIAASIMFAALRNNDNVGLCLFTERVEKFMWPRKGKKFVLRLLRELVCHEAKSAKTDINGALIHLSRTMRRRSVIFVLSDFLSGDFEKPLKFIRNRHDVILVNLRDTREREMPDVGYVFLEDGETGEQMLVDTGDGNFRKMYAGLAEKRHLELAAKMKKIKVDMVTVNTNEPFHVPLRKFFAFRKRRMGR